MQQQAQADRDIVSVHVEDMTGGANWSYYVTITRLSLLTEGGAGEALLVVMSTHQA